MMQYNIIEWNCNLKRRRELHFYKDSLVKTTILVPVYIWVVSSLFLVCRYNNKLLDIVISDSVFKKVNRNKSFVSIKIISFSCLDIGLIIRDWIPRLTTMYLLRLEERQKFERYKYDDLSSGSSSENTSNKGGGIFGSRNKSKCERLTEIIMNYGTPNGQLDILRQVMKRPLPSTTLELISSRSSESSA